MIRQLGNQHGVVRSGGNPQLVALLTGLAVTGWIAFLAITATEWGGIGGLSPLLVAMLAGMALRNCVGPFAGAETGIRFSSRVLLRLAVVLLGFQITLSQIAATGLAGVAVVVVALVATFVFIRIVGRMLGVERALADLIAAGTSVCGASAIIACNTVTRGSDEDVSYAVACISLFGSLSIVLFPLLAGLIGLSPQQFGLWAGASIHEVGQVAAATFANGEVADQAGMIAKLNRILLLAPLILVLSMLAARRGGPAGVGKAPVPWFVFGFMAVVTLNSFVDLPTGWREPIVSTTVFFLAVALAGIGLDTDFRKLRLKGLRPLALAALGWVFISTLALGLVVLLP